MKKLIISLLLVFLTSPSFATDYYVREGGGTTTQCTGLANVDYDGSGTGEACAFSNLYWATGTHDGGGIISGGDTVYIASGSYITGYGSGPTGYYCSATNASYDCYNKALPSGPDADHPTKILGEGWDTGCSNPPELWGTQRNTRTLNLSGSSNIEIKCLEITDHASCGPSSATDGDNVFPPAECVRDSYPHGEYAEYGIYALASSNVLLQDLNIHGFGYGALHAGGLTDWALRDVRMYGNGHVGWQGDVSGTSDDDFSGTITLDGVTIQYSGCVESYPSLAIGNCIGQGDGGYGDGFGSQAIGGNWIISNSNFSFNTQDGLDMLYHRNGGDITITNSKFEGNAGNQAKLNVDAGLGDSNGGTIIIENSIFIGNCDYYEVGDGDDTANPGGPLRNINSTFLNCRGGGGSLAAIWVNGGTLKISNSTFTGRGDSTILAADSYLVDCNGNEKLYLYNNIFMGNYKWEDSGNRHDLDWIYNTAYLDSGSSGCDAYTIPTESKYNIVYNFQNNYPTVNLTPPIGTGDSGADPLLEDSPEDGYVTSVYLTESSPARDAADETITCVGDCSVDYNSFSRGSSWDIGALEYGSEPAGEGMFTNITLTGITIQ